jgi:hypothetical protein
MNPALACTLVASIAAVGCGHFARETTEYSVDVRQMLASRNDAVSLCYGRVLEQMPTAAGTVALRFRVVPETGRLAKTRINPAKTTAPEPVQRCILENLDEMKLDPPDVNEAVGEVVWNFTPRKG